MTIICQGVVRGMSLCQPKQSQKDLDSEPMHQPNLKRGLAYWERQEASVDGVLGGYGNGSLPRIDALSSRLYLLSVAPHLCTIPSALRPLEKDETYRYRALDVGTVGSTSGFRITHICSAFKVQALEESQKMFYCI